MFTLGASSQLSVAKARKSGMFATTLLDVEVELVCSDLDVGGTDLDASWVREQLKSLIESLSHQALDEHPAFIPHGATPARIARYLCRKLSEVSRAKLGTSRNDGHVRVIVKEPPDTWAAFVQRLGDPK